MLTLNKKEFINKFDIDSSNYFHESVRVVISDSSYGFIVGKNNYFSAGCIIFTATGYRENTLIGSNNYFGPSTVIKNDVLIGDNNRVEMSSYIGNLSTILHHTVLEANCNICDQTTIGSYSQIGCLTPIFKDVKPFSKVYGNPPQLKNYSFSKELKKSFSQNQLQQIRDYVQKGITPEDISIVTKIDEFNNFSKKKVY